MAELGHQAGGIATWATLAAQANETNPDLLWPKSIDVYDRMRREDSQVGSVLRAVTLPIRSTEWMIDPAGARDEVVELVARDLGLPIKGQAPAPPPRLRDRFSWDEHLRLALLCLPFGHSFFEQVYRPEGDRMHLRKLAWRPPRTIADIEVAPDGGLVAIVQHGLSGGRRVRIPVDRLVAYVNDREGANWLGQSLLRQAYKNWLLKDRILRIQALTVERNGLGIPVYTGAGVPEGLDPDKVEEWLESEKQAGLDIAKQLRAGDAAGASIPNGASLQLMGVTGKLPDTDGPIRYHDEQIARAVLAHFLNLGTETGSWALGSTFANFFTDSLNAVSQSIADTATQHVVEDLVDLNWGPDEPAPRISSAAIGSEHPATAEAIKALIDCGALTKDPGLEAHLRALYGLPVLGAELAAKGVPVDAAAGLAEEAEAAAARARFAAETAQKAYLATDRPPLTRREVRELIAAAGADIDPDAPEETQEASS